MVMKFMNINNPIDTTLDTFDQGLLAGRLELADTILSIVKRKSNALDKVTNTMYNRHQLRLVVPSENPDASHIKENKDASDS